MPRLPIGVKQVWGAALLVQVALSCIFLSIGLWSDAAHNLVVWRGLDPILSESVGDAFCRYMWCVGITGTILVSCTVSQRKQLQRDVSVKDLVVLVLFHLGMFYIVATRCLQFTLVGDDAYIDYRYVQHWLVGQPDYNPGERVMGFTAHLHLMLLALVHSIVSWVDIPQTSNVLNALLDAATYATLYAYLKRINAPRSAALFGAWMFALSIYSISSSTTGKEFSLGAFLIVFSLWAFECERLTSFAWASCGLALTRPEGAIYCAIAFVFSLTKRLSSIRVWIAPALCVLIWEALLYLYYGTILPQGAVTKAVVYLKRNQPYECLLEIVRFIGLSSSGWMRFEDMYNFTLIATIPLTLLGLVLLVVLVLLSRKSQSVRIYLLSVICIVAFYAIPNSRLFSWYMFWFLFVGIIAYAGILRDIAQSPLPSAIRRGIAALAFLFLLSPVSLYPKTASVSDPFFIWEVTFKRFLDYTRVAEYVKQKGGTKDEIALPEPGVLGFFHPGPVLDMGGLISSKVLKYYPKVVPLQGQRTVWYEPPPACVAAFRPKYVCLFEMSLFEKDNFFRDNYTLEHEWPQNTPGFKTMSLFVLKQKEHPARLDPPVK